MEKQRRRKMSVQPYPWTVRIYKGEGRFLIVEEVEHRAGYNTYSDKITIVSETEDDLVDKLGNKVLSRIKAVENSPLYVGKPKQFWNCLKTEVMKFIQLKNSERKKVDIMAA